MNDEEGRKLFNLIKSGELSPDEALNLPPKERLIKTGSSLNTRTFVSKKVGDRLAQYAKEQEIRLTSQQHAIPFIQKELMKTFSLQRGLVLLGAKSGDGKSTIAANILAGFYETFPTRTAIVISNEETSEAVYNRVACVLLKKNFNAFHAGDLKFQDNERIANKAMEIAQRIEVVDDDSWDMTCIEDVQAVLENAARTDTGLVMLDYLQTVVYSKERPQAEPFQVSKMLGYYLKDYGKRATVPVAVFAQLSPEGENAKDISQRIQNDRTMFNHAFSVVEIIPDKKSRVTKFKVHKERFAIDQNKEFDMLFVDGRLEVFDDI